MADIKLGTASQQLADQLTAAGLATVVDARDLVLPGAWLTIGSVSFDRLDPNVYEGTWDLFLVAPDLPAPEALDHLGQLLTNARTAGLDVGNVTAITITLANHSAEPLPALQLQVITQITETD